MSKRVLSYIVLIICSVVVISGCGETFRGAVTDTKRIGAGIRTIFVGE